jgi:hypothetical protein
MPVKSIETHLLNVTIFFVLHHWYSREGLQMIMMEHRSGNTYLLIYRCLAS